jgi:hypothetical protein
MFTLSLWGKDSDDAVTSTCVGAMSLVEMKAPLWPSRSYLQHARLVEAQLAGLACSCSSISTI